MGKSPVRTINGISDLEEIAIGKPIHVRASWGRGVYAGLMENEDGKIQMIILQRCEDRFNKSIIEIFYSFKEDKRIYTAGWRCNVVYAKSNRHKYRKYNKMLKKVGY